MINKTHTKLTEHYKAGISGNIFIERMTNERSSAPFIMHYHTFYEIYFLYSGNRDYIIDGEVFNLNSGCVSLIKPGHLHMTEGGSYDRILIQFERSFLNNYFEKDTLVELMSCFDCNYIRIPSTHLESMKHQFIRLAKSFNQKQEVLICIYLSELLLSLKECIKEGNHSKDAPLFSDKRIAKILKYINANYMSIDNISAISAEFFISKYYLCRLFKESVGVTFVTYLTNVKLSHAMDLLKSTRKSVTEISIMCGFNSPVHFCNTFKKNISMSPTEYRKINK